MSEALEPIHPHGLNEATPVSPRSPAWRNLIAAALLCIQPSQSSAEPPKPTSSPPNTPKSGSLVIAGGGKLPDAIHKRFIALAGKRIVVIPTASEDADDPRWRAAHYANKWTENGATVEWLHARSRAEAERTDFAKSLEQASAVWLGGGDQSRLTAMYKGTDVERELKSLLHDRHGVIGGTSAGAAAMSTIMITGGKLTAEVDVGFGLTPEYCVIDQHFSQRKRLQRLMGVVNKDPHRWGVGVDEDTAAVIVPSSNGHVLDVVGKNEVTIIYRDQTSQKFKPGDRIQLSIGTPISNTRTGASNLFLRP